MKLLYGLVATSLFASQLLNAAVAVQRLSDQDVKEIKDIITKNLENAEKALDLMAAKIRLYELKEKPKEKEFKKSQEAPGLFPETIEMIIARRSPAKTRLIKETNEASDAYRESEANIRKLHIRLTDEGLVNDHRLIGLWQQVDNYKKRYNDLHEKIVR